MSDTRPERDWEAEFQAIAQRLGSDVETGGTSKTSGVNRHIVPGPPEATASGEVLHEQPPRASSHESSASQTPEVTHGRDAAAPAARSSSTVPGFRPEWRLPDPRAESPAHEGMDEDDDADSFVEPDPTPLDVSDPSVVIMVAALVLGPLWLVYLVFFHREAPTLWWAGGVGVTLAGFALAVMRQPRERDEDDPDDGARV